MGDVIPLFPLNTVLFPGNHLPLRVFEERYHLLLEEALVGDGCFGVALTYDDEVATDASPAAVGTLVRVAWASPAGDERQVLLEGLRRFRVLRVDRTLPYQRAEVEYLNEVPGEDARELAARALTLLQGVTRRENLELPEEPGELAYRLAEALPLPPGFAQELLEEPTVAGRLARIVAILERFRGRLA